MVLNAVKAGKGAHGYNAGTGEYGDMLEEGILDPAKVTRLALKNAASVAGLLLTTEAMIRKRLPLRPIASTPLSVAACSAGGGPHAAYLLTVEVSKNKEFRDVPEARTRCAPDHRPPEVLRH